MKRRFFLSGAVLLCVASLVQAVAPVAKPEPPSAARQLQEKLARPVEIPGFEANTPLKEALGYLSEKFDITIIIDTASFQNDVQIQEPEHQPVKLPALKDVPLREILRMLGRQCQGYPVQRGNLVVFVVGTRAQEAAL
ncbi:MAG: hypothetical protein AB7K24_16820, partial [Gemmataceae bacterium]